MTIFDYLSMLSYGLTAIGYIMVNILWLRIFILVGCTMDAAIYLFIRPGNPLWVQVTMNSVFVLINAAAIIKLIRDLYPPGFTGEIAELYKNIFSQLTFSEFRSLLSIAEWKTVAPGEVLIEEGETDISPMIVTEGKVLIEQNKVVLAFLEKGSILGEINFLTNIPPKNRVITLHETRIFKIPRDKLIHLIERHSGIKAVIYSIFGCNIATKLKLMNDEKSVHQ